MKSPDIAPVLQSKTHGTARYLLAFLCCLTVALSACDSPPPPPVPLPALHAPGLVYLEAFTRLEETKDDPWVSSLLAYRSPTGPGDTHLLILQGPKALYDTTLDGSAEFHPAQAAACYNLGGVDPKSGQVLCQGKDDSTGTSGIIAFHPDTTTSPWPGRLLVSAASFQEEFVRPTWAPDGHVFAVLHIKQSEKDIDVFAVDDKGGQVRQLAKLVMPLSTLDWLSWSPDGKWLAFAGGMGSFSATYGLPIASLLRQVPAAPHAPLDITVRSDQLVTLADRPILGQAWRPGTTDLVYRDGEFLTELNVTTGQHRVLLAIPDGSLCALTWTPDGNRLIFAHCRSVPADMIPPPAQIYVYTMSYVL